MLKPIITGTIAFAAISSLAFTTFISNQIESLPEIEVPNVSGQPFGTAFVSTTSKLIDFTVNKHGGFVSNDTLPPFVMLDNIPSCETGINRDAENPTGGLAYMNKLNADFMASKMFYTQKGTPSNVIEIQSKLSTKVGAAISMQFTENSYKDAVSELNKFLPKLEGGRYEKRAKDVSDLFNSYAKYLSRVNDQLDTNIDRGPNNNITPVSGLSPQGDKKVTDKSVAQKVKDKKVLKDTVFVDSKPNYWLIDDVFHEAKCVGWHMLHSLSAIRIDYEDVLRDKSVLTELDEAINWLRYTQVPFTTTYVQHGSGRGFGANYGSILLGDLGNAKSSLNNIKSHLLNN